jgi:hypothetical protein
MDKSTNAILPVNPLNSECEQKALHLRYGRVRGIARQKVDV